MRLSVLSVLVALILGLSSIASAAFQTVGPFREAGGLVVIEAESIDTSGTAWAKETNNGGFTGQSYLRFAGGNNFCCPPSNDILEYRFHITDGGTYNFRMRGRKDGHASDADNDSWIKIGGGSNWVKIFTSNAQGSWNWDSVLEPGHGHFETNIRREFGPGEHVIQLTARSSNHKIDRMVLWKDGVDGLNLNNPESATTPPEPTSWTMDFRNNQSHGFTSGGAFRVPSRTLTSRGLCIRGDAGINETSFGFWSGVLNGVTLEPSGIYEVNFVVSSDAHDGNKGQLPTLRVRINDTSFQSGLSLAVESEGNAALAPTTDGKRYKLYYFAPNEVAGNGMLLSFDWIFAPGNNRPDMAAYLAEITVQKLN